MTSTPRRWVEPIRQILPVGPRRRLVRSFVHLRRFPLTSPRMLPDFLVIGGMRCGTSSLFRYLAEHPSIARSLRKEVEYFSVNYERGLTWYRAHFPKVRRQEHHAEATGFPLLTFEASPGYLPHPLAPSRTFATIPEVKLIVLLRSPVERAYSHWQHMVRVGRETMGFEQAVSHWSTLAEQALRQPVQSTSLHDYLRSYVHRSMYAEQLSRWLDVFPRDRFCVLESHDLYSHPADTMGTIFEFLGLPAHQASTYENHSQPAVNYREEAPKLDQRMRGQLLERLASQQSELQSLLGQEFQWS